MVEQLGRGEGSRLWHGRRTRSSRSVGQVEDRDEAGCRWGERRGVLPRRCKRSRSRGRKGEDEVEEKGQEEGEGEDQAMFGGAAERHLRPHGGRSRPADSESSDAQGPEDQTRQEEEEGESLPKQRERGGRQRQLYNVLEYGGRVDWVQRAIRGREKGAADLEEGPRSTELRCSPGHETEPDDSRRIPEFQQRGKPATSGKSILSATPTKSGGASDGSRNAALVPCGRPDAQRKARCSARRCIAADQELGADRKGRSERHRTEARVGRPREGVAGYNTRGIGGWQGGVAGGACTPSKLPRQSVGVAERQGLVKRRQRKGQGQRPSRQRQVRRQRKERQGQRKRKREERGGEREVAGIERHEEADRGDFVESRKGEEEEPCGRGFSSTGEESKGRPLEERSVHGKPSQLEGGNDRGVFGPDAPLSKAAQSSARGAEDKGVLEPRILEGGERAAPNPPEWRRESEVASSRVSPSTMLQAMNAARVLMEKLDEERTQSTAMEVEYSVHDSIFPLPLPRCRNEGSSKAYEQMVFGLNHLATGHGQGAAPSRCPEGLTENLSMLCERFDVWERTIDPVDFESFFKKRGVTYAGEEIRLAQTLCWEAVRNSLPEQVGQLRLVDFCTEGTLHYVRRLEDFLIPVDTMVRVRPPKVMVGDDWPALSRGLVDRGICEVWPVEKLYHIDQEPLLNGLFAVGKGEFVGPLETQRLIMNLIPFNKLCEPLVGEVCTLPSIASFQSFLLDEGEVAVMSAEDIRCFFYLFQVPVEWKRFLGFNREVEEDLIPKQWKGKRCVLVSRVLPMGFINSVSIAQHIHRNVVKWSQQSCPHGLGAETEMRRDRVGSSSSSLFRVYLDNFDLLERQSKEQAELIRGTVSQAVQALREEYSRLGLPRHPKKSTERVFKAEIQGAIVDGELGFAMPRPEKVLLYVSLGLCLVQRRHCTLKELQVVCGGFVYFCMFRRPLLCALNEVWRFMVRLKRLPPVVRMPLPKQVMRELLRFILLCPLAQMSFKLPLGEHVTCSDASTSGGGFCVSEGLTGYGMAALDAEVRGDIPEEIQTVQVLTVGLFDGLGALRLAVDALGIPVAGHLSVEKEETARRVVESYFPDAIFHDDVQTVDGPLVRDLSLRYPSVGLVLIGAGPPCQGVSGLNAGRKGALLDARSSLFQEVPRIKTLFEEYFPWAQVHLLMESVASMSEQDREIMSRTVELQPYFIDCASITLCHRPRLYWVSWELCSDEGVKVTTPVEASWGDTGTVELNATVHDDALLERGWSLRAGCKFPTFTTSRP